jgi:hypothetical protein
MHASHSQVDVPPPPPAVSQPHSHGGQVVPGGQVGHTQVQVPSSAQPVPPQSQPHGGHTSPAGQSGQAQVQVPPPPPPVQSQSQGGQSSPIGQ